MKLFNPKGKLVLTFYDMVTGTIIQDPLQVEIRRERQIIDTKVVRDGTLILNDVPRTHRGMLGIGGLYYRYRFEITSSAYKEKRLRFKFDRHTRNANLDIALEPKKTRDNTIIY